jgi:alpha-D-xyloside xylohydrolase
MLKAIKGARATVKSICRKDDSLILTTENGKLKFEPYSDSVVRIAYTLSDNFRCTDGPGTTPVKSGCEWQFTQDDAIISLTTNRMKLVVDKQTSAISYYDRNGRLLVKEPSTGGKTLERFDSYKSAFDAESITEKIVTPDGIKKVVRGAKKEFCKSLYHTRLELQWTDGEALYGLGQQEEGSLNLRGTRQYIHQANLKVAMPVLVSTKGYGILFNTYSPLIFNDDEYGSYIYNVAANELNFYFIYGESLDGVVGGYRTISGQAVMPPKWVFGYMQSLERYEDQQEIIDTVMEYRRRNIPLDSIVLDWNSWEEGMWGQKTFDPSRFPDVGKMTDTLHETGVRFMVSIWSNMNEKTANYIEMKENNLLFPKSNIYDAFKEEARALYWKQVNEGLFSKGVDAWWCDASEPFTPEWNTPVKPEPDKSLTQFHETASNYISEENTNAFSLMHSRAIYEGQRSVTDRKRVVNLTRSSYTGQQRYGTIAWSGDISAKWNTLKKQIPAGLNFCAAGMPYWTLDIGAFFVKRGNFWFWDGEYEDGCEDMGYRELYTRWFQYGAFLPVFRSHGTDTRREVWQFGEKGEMFYDSLVKFTELRYRLLPYIYSMAGMVTLKDYTMLRLLAFDFADDNRVFDIKDQFMFGNAIMVCPVTQPMYYAHNSVPLENMNKTRDVYLPAGTVWYDFGTGMKQEGGRVITANAAIDTMPLYVKAGSIVPMAEAVQHSGESSNSELRLLVYPGADGAFTIYQDENDNYNYEKGEYALIDLSWHDGSSTLIIGKRKGTYAGMPEVINFTVEIIGREPYKVTYAGEEISKGLQT